MSPDRPDVVVVGAGTAGIPCAIEAARTRRVLVVERSEAIGGTLAVSAGHMSAAGCRRQRQAGVVDSPEQHYQDVMAIGGGRADPELVRLAVEEAPRTVDWLDDHGFDFDPATPAIYRGHSPYSQPRTVWGRRHGASILETMRPLWDAAVAEGRITLLTGARVVGLEIAGGAVDGVTVATGEGERAVGADAVVLASGGYGASEELFGSLTPGSPRLVTNALPTATGDALVMAREAGAALRFGELHTPRLGILEQPAGRGRADFWSAMLQLTAAERPPWEIWVNERGERFVAEDRPDVTAQEHVVAAQPGAHMWVVFDERGRRSWSSPLVRQWDDARFEAEAVAGALVHRAGDLAALAAAAGVAGEGLVRSVAEFNAAVAAGDDRFGRTTFLAPIAEPPFYAIGAPCTVLCTFGGVDVDATMAARRPDGSTVSGLFAVGEAIGMGATSGQAFCGGMSVTPALSFGRILGRALAGP